MSSVKQYHAQCRCKLFMLCNILHHNGHILCYFGKDRNTERLYQLWCSSGPGSCSAHPPSSGGAPEEVTTAADAGDQEAEGDHFSGSKQLQPKLLDIVTSQRDRFRARYALWLRPLFPLASLSSHPQQGAGSVLEEEEGTSCGQPARLVACEHDSNQSITVCCRRHYLLNFELSWTESQLAQA